MIGPRRYLAYMAGRSTPFFLGVLNQFVRMAGQIESFEFVIGDRFSYDWAKGQAVDPRIRLSYQHDRFDPFTDGRSWSDAELARLEQRYGAPNLRRYILAHRIIDRLPDERKVAYLACYLDYYEKLFERTRPDVFITGGQDSIPFLAANQVFKRNGCVSLVMTPGWIPGWVFVVDNEFVQIPGVEREFAELKRRALTPEETALAAQIRNAYLVKRVRPAVFAVGHAIAPVPSPLRFAEALVRRFRHADKFYDASVGEQVRHSLLVRARAPFQRRAVRAVAGPMPENSRFFYYPLQYEPEAGIDVLGTEYRDQISVIDQIAAALPAGYRLCVKEHPNMHPSFRPLGFYDRIRRIDGVRWLDKSIDGHEVLARCAGVITIAGSSGFEALFYGKPVILLGRTFYEPFTEGVFRPQGLEQLSARMLEMSRFTGYDPGLVDRFVVAVLRRSYKGWSELAADGVHSEQNYAVLADALRKELAYRRGPVGAEVTGV